VRIGGTYNNREKGLSQRNSGEEKNKNFAQSGEKKNGEGRGGKMVGGQKGRREEKEKPRLKKKRTGLKGEKGVAMEDWKTHKKAKETEKKF